MQFIKINVNLPKGYVALTDLWLYCNCFLLVLVALDCTVIVFIIVHISRLSDNWFILVFVAVDCHVIAFY